MRNIGVAIAATAWVFGLAGASTGQSEKLTPDQIIQSFSEKESQFYSAWTQYAYHQYAEIRVLSANGRKRNERLFLGFEVVFSDDGTREVRQVERRGRLNSVQWTKEDVEVLTNLQPFALTAKELPLYKLKYEGRERVDEIDTYVFSVKPKSKKGGRLYFQGKIWVDDVDLQIVRTMGKPVPEGEQRFPEFETLRQIVDGEYWFPVWTYGKSELRFRGGNVVEIEQTVTFEDYRRFGSKATIDFGGAATSEDEDPPN